MEEVAHHHIPKQKVFSIKNLSLLIFGGLLTITLVTVSLVKQNQDIRQRAQVAPTTFTETFDGTPLTPLPFSNPRWEVIFHTEWGVPIDRPNPTSGDAVLPLGAHHGPGCEPPGIDGTVVHPAPLIKDFVFNCRDHVMTHLPDADYGVVYMTPNHMVDLKNGSGIIRFDVSTLSRSTRDWIDVWVQEWNTQEQSKLDEEIPTSQGEPRNSFHLEAGGGCGGFTSANGDFHVEVFDANRARIACIPGGPGWRSVLSPSAVTRSTVQIDFTPGHIKVWMPNNNSHVLVEGSIPTLPFTEGIVSFGHHSYTPHKGEDPFSGAAAGRAGTWHWDNVFISPAVPFTIINSDHRSAMWEDSATTRTFNFASPAPANSYLRFEAFAESVRASFNGGSLQAATRTSAFRSPEHAASYLMTVPAGTTRATFDITPSFGFIGQINSPTIFSKTASSVTPVPTSSTPIPTTNTPTPTTVVPTLATPTPTRTPTPTTTITAMSDLSLSPATQSVSNGTTFPVQVRVNTNGQMVNAIQANITYPSSLLEIVSVSNSGGAFEVEAEKSVLTGTANLAYGTTTPKSGNLLVATITFQAKAGGSAAVSYAASSEVVSSVTNTNVLRNRTGGTYTITSIVPTNSPTPVSGKVGDLNNDGNVNLTDLSILLSNWATSNAVADINKDGTVGLVDLSMLLSNWGL